MTQEIKCTLREKMIVDAMAFNLKTGMNLCRINPFAIAREEYGIKGRTKQDIYDRFLDLLAKR